MAGSLDGRARRVSRLEDGRQVPCEECGFEGAWSDVEVVWVDPGASDPADLKRCGTCDTQLEYIVTWADIPPTPAISAEDGS